jgi:hypothetical protein
MIPKSHCLPLNVLPLISRWILYVLGYIEDKQPLKTVTFYMKGADYL